MMETTSKEIARGIMAHAVEVILKYGSINYDMELEKLKAKGYIKQSALEQLQEFNPEKIFIKRIKFPQHEDGVIDVYGYSEEDFKKLKELYEKAIIEELSK